MYLSAEGKENLYQLLRQGLLQRHACRILSGLNEKKPCIYAAVSTLKKK